MSPRPEVEAELQPLAPGESAARTWKARTGYRCAGCNGWISRSQSVTITTGLRTMHTGCFIDARNLRDGQPPLPFPDRSPA